MKIKEDKNEVFLKFKEYNSYLLNNITESELWFSHPEKFSDDYEKITGLHDDNLKLYHKIGICSLTPYSNCYNDYLWENYANNHTGVCLVYSFNPNICYTIDLDDSLEHNDKYSEEFFDIIFSNPNLEILPILYLEKHSIDIKKKLMEVVKYPLSYANTSDEIDSYFKVLLSFKKRYVENLIDEKIEEFKKEKEYRWFHFFDEDLSKNNWGKTLKKEVAYIILGKNTARSSIEEILKVCENTQVKILNNTDDFSYIVYLIYLEKLLKNNKEHFINYENILDENTQLKKSAFKSLFVDIYFLKTVCENIINLLEKKSIEYKPKSDFFEHLEEKAFKHK